MSSIFGGRLSLTQGRPVPINDVQNAATLYYSPCEGGTVPIYNGSSFVDVSFLSGPTDQNGLSLGITGLTANAIYDVFVKTVSGAATLVAGTAWTSDTARAVGLEYYSGILVNSADHGQTYLGTIHLDGSSRLNWIQSFGQSRRFDVWNAYNRRQVTPMAGDPTAGQYIPYWGPNNFGPSNNDPTNCFTFVLGLPDQPVTARYHQGIFMNEPLSGSGVAYSSAVGWGLTGIIAVPAGFQGFCDTIDAGAIQISKTATAVHIETPFIGAVTVTAYEKNRYGANNVNGVWCARAPGGSPGAASNEMLLTADWMG